MRCAARAPAAAASSPAARIGFETPLHRPIRAPPGEREQAHALVVRHERAHDRMVCAVRHADGRVVDGFVETIRRQPPSRPSRCRFAHTLAARPAAPAHHGVRRDHQLLREPALQAEAGHAERAVLIVLRGVGHVVARFGDAPGHVCCLPYAIWRATARGRSRRASVPGRTASPAAASGTRTSSRSRTAAPGRLPPMSAAGRARTSAPAARWPCAIATKMRRAALRTPADRSSHCRDGLR